MRAAQPARERAESPAGGNLALLYQGVLTGVLRIQSGRQTLGDATGFRRRMKEALSDVEHEALRMGYTKGDVTDANYAVVAFLDEAVLSSSDPARSKWSSLQAELFGVAVAGVGFFDRLRDILGRQDAGVADILEIYYLCLLLGYRGRYGGLEYDDVQQTVQEVRHQLERLRTGSSPRFSPATPTAPIPSTLAASITEDPVARFRVTAYVTCGGAVFCWMIFKAILWIQADSVRELVRRTIVP